MVAAARRTKNEGARALDGVEYGAIRGRRRTEGSQSRTRVATSVIHVALTPGAGHDAEAALEEQVLAATKATLPTSISLVATLLTA